MTATRLADVVPAPLKGTRYAVGTFTPAVGLTARPRPITVLFLDGVIVDRGSRADVLRNAKAPAGSPLGACHARYDAVRVMALAHQA